MSEYWTEKDVIENAILDLQHERDDLQAELARRDEIIRRLKEDGERLASSGLWLGKFLGMKDCIFCGMRAKRKAEIEHTPLCPITLLRALMKELEKEATDAD